MLRLDTIDTEIVSVRSAMEALENTASTEGRELSAEEISQSDALFARHEELRAERAPLVARQASLAQTASIVAKTAGPSATGNVDVTAGEWLSLYSRAKGGDTQAAQLLARTVAQQAVNDLDNTAQGIIPVSIVGNLIKFNDASRPVFSSFTQRPMPAAGKTFLRPRITTRVNVAETAELTEFPSRKMVIADDTVTKRKFAGQLEISEESLDWSDPAFLDIALQDFADYYNEVTEDAACDYLENLPVTTSAYTTTNIGTIVQSYVDAVQVVYNASKRFPDTVWLPLDDWGTLVAKTGANSDESASVLLKRALSEFGLDISFKIAPVLSTPVIGCSGLVEAYEQKKGLLQAYNTNLGALDVAYRGYVSFYGRREGFVYLGATQGS